MHFCHDKKMRSICKKCSLGKKESVPFNVAIRLHQELEDSITDIKRHSIELKETRIDKKKLENPIQKITKMITNRMKR